MISFICQSNKNKQTNKNNKNTPTPQKKKSDCGYKRWEVGGGGFRERCSKSTNLQLQDK